MCAPHPIPANASANATYYTPQKALCVAFDNGAVDAVTANPAMDAAREPYALPALPEVRRNAKARRAERRADAVLFETSTPLDPDAIIQRDIRATIRFNIGLLLLVGIVAALALFLAH